ncbi:BREX-1 system adenine-specific DNA-methyltransferase PglX [Bacillus sp. S3]|uniref:BREX-1 system adenine-specific DNA-methyltransferase PglX n=1 Tax=Bacillus sp. S3 TaxID=486398 RepID=UPI00118A2C3F|nr:BREX-1 system adenine-specific DNA-methyltransferase PglX [Bacillus sp. S3]QCJ42885.1 BREX-1 system adenine-specific DNA-methyltransferase PglX [Bacillus sp. S3]
MNKKALREFAVYARNELRNQISLRAQSFGITENSIPSLLTGADYVEVNGIKHPITYKKGIEKLLTELKTKGYDHVIEEVAYTWFNRLIAIRFMEVHNDLPSKVRVLSSETKGKVDPDILTEYQFTDLSVNKQELASLITQGNQEEAYRKLLVAQCNELSEIMPFLFEKLADYSELLLQQSLLHADSLINRLVTELAEEDFQEVEVIGWLYQYYMSEKKEQVGGLKNNAVKKEDLPVVTQLFTPRWIVEYMVQNSLGKLYDHWNPDNELAKQWAYYLKSSERLPTPSIASLEEIKIIDPACGSGHILVYAFDLLYDMYLEAGYSERDIPRLIIEKNLYGMDIDKRAVQIACFALMMKGQEKYRRFLKKATNLKLNILEFNDSKPLSEEATRFMADKAGDIGWITSLQKQFENAKQFGSLIVPKEAASFYLKFMNFIHSSSIEATNLLEEAVLIEIKENLLPLIEQAYLLAVNYEAVVTNPPYHNKYNPILKNFLNDNYKEYKSDLYSAFIYRSIQLTTDYGFAGLMTPFTWMFIATHEKLREYIIANQSISSLIQLEYSAFSEATVPICTFVIQNQKGNTKGEYIRLEGFKGTEIQPVKVREAVEKAVSYRYTSDSKDFYSIPGSPFAFWSSKQVRNIFKNNPKLAEIAEPRVGLQTSDNDRFIRLWYEVIIDKIGFHYESNEDACKGKRKWFPYNKGGEYRKWYGNQDYVVNWENNGWEIKNFVDSKGKLKSRPQNTQYYFKEGLTWTAISSSRFSVRYSPKGFIFSNAGMMVFTDKYLKFLLGLLNSKLTSMFTQQLSSTINFDQGIIARIPVKLNDTNSLNIVDKNIHLAKNDWISFETSWDFKQHPFLTYNQQATKLEKCYENWEKHSENQFRQLQQNEESLNQFFIDLYGLQDELTPKVTDDEISVRLADRGRDARSFLSYCIGLMMGRYSLDVAGLAFAGGNWDARKYTSFQPDSDGIIPLTDSEYFEDDVVKRLQELLVLIFGQESLAENLRWLAESLVMKANETPVERLRRYFFDEFYADHYRIYQKRPIYWMVESGNKKGFRALFYLHRYTPETLATMRFSYVQNLQEKLRQEQKRLEQDLMNPNLSAATKKRYDKHLSTIKAQQEELIDFDRKLAELANRRIFLDLDDGVVVNYAMMQNVLAKIK